MWTAQSRKTQHLNKAKFGVLLPMVVTVCVLTACSKPAFPDNTPTKAEVPFLETRLTQQAILEWRQKNASQRQEQDAQWRQEKAACYQRFFVNNCLKKAQEAYRKEKSILHKRDLELNRQERALVEIDRQLRLKQKRNQLQF